MGRDIDGLAQARKNKEFTIDARRYLHQHPELSGVEFETLAYIRANLDFLGISWVEVAEGGILASLGDQGKGKTLLLRADIDALPIQENPRNLTRGRAVISENPGIQHACGHDAHTAMLLTAGKILKEYEQDIPGRVLLMFERGEERGGNLNQILQYIKDQEIHIHGSHAIHVRPGVPAGKIVVIDGPVMAGACGFNITIIGKDGHSSRPDLANNPLDCFSSFYQSLKDIRLRNISPFEHFTLSVGKLNFGEKTNIIARELNFQGSARFFREESGDRFFETFNLLLDNTARAHHCTYTINHQLRGIPVINRDPAVRFSRQGIRKYLGDDYLIDQYDPMMGADDFALIAKLYPSVMIHLGIDNPEKGSGADLHTDIFDLDEEVLHLGVAATIGFVLEFLGDGRG
ncbi:peptidase, M20/M25/M40 family [Treponema primitia ZAS-2]|uniref:Peptidase, M20/M25/M40 family n=1 Tax=Treponema primitia (strain ATCC BAA-887 / DSM 12427 / ZAS-2) TaxID=545694 RepID=F5YK68_TREPZ|nr:amidohydrolase [Treponema primitia]AEF83654.1 peptidase, M20/M25/M40 family [Treponema primitia ZAS-2]